MKVHKRIYTPGFDGKPCWDILCGFEAWNGALMSDDEDEVTCDDCKRGLKCLARGKR